MMGTITYFNAARGFGFITVAPEGKRIFFHVSNFQGEPVLQGLVEFELGAPISIGKQLQAVKVRYLSTFDEVFGAVIGGGK